jgi:hypothetical protein
VNDDFTFHDKKKVAFKPVKRRRMVGENAFKIPVSILLCRVKADFETHLEDFELFGTQNN